MKKVIFYFFFFFLISFSLSLPKKIRASLPFNDDFETNSLDKWDIIQGEWTTNVYLNSIWLSTQTPNNIAHEIQAGNFDWTNYSFSFDILPKTGVDRNVFFRVNNERTDILSRLDIPVSYMLHLKPDIIILRRWLVDSKDALVTVSGGLPNGVVSHMNIQAKNNNIKVYLNHSPTPIIDYTDINFPIVSGRIALAAFPGNDPSEVWYDNVMVTELSSSTPTPTPIPSPTPLPPSPPPKK